MRRSGFGLVVGVVVASAVSFSCSDDSSDSGGTSPGGNSSAGTRSLAAAGRGGTAPASSSTAPVGGGQSSAGRAGIDNGGAAGASGVAAGAPGTGQAGSGGSATGGAAASVGGASGGTGGVSSMGNVAGAGAPSVGGAPLVGSGAAGGSVIGIAGSTASAASTTAAGTGNVNAAGAGGQNQGGAAGQPVANAAGTAGAVGSTAAAGAAGQSNLPGDNHWRFQRPLEVANGSSRALTSFQVAFEIDTSDSSRFRPDCADVRIKTRNGLSLPYWVEPETCGTTHTVVWTRVPALPVGNTSLELQYGNAAASNESSGSLVFPNFFEDFSGAAIDTTLWTSVGNVSWTNPTQAGGELLFAGTSQQPYPEYWENFSFAESDFLLDASRALVLEARARRVASSGGTGSTFRIGLCEHPTPSTYSISFVGGGNDLGDATGAFVFGVNTNPKRGQDGDSERFGVPVSFSADYHRLTVRYTGQEAVGAVDGTSSSVADFTPTNLLSVVLWTNARTEGTTIEARYDWVLVREFATSEPTVTVGTETLVP